MSVFLICDYLSVYFLSGRSRNFKQSKLCTVFSAGSKYRRESGQKTNKHLKPAGSGGKLTDSDPKNQVRSCHDPLNKAVSNRNTGICGPNASVQVSIRLFNSMVTQACITKPLKLIRFCCINYVYLTYLLCFLIA